MRRHLQVVALALIGALPSASADARSVVHIRAGAPLYASPEGHMLKHGRNPVFESGRAWVVRRRGPWLAIPSAQLPNGRLGWIRQTSARKLSITRTLVRVDLSARRVWVTRGAELLLSAPVAIGAPASPSPVALTSVADILPVAAGSIYPRSTYGPVIVALRLAQALPSPGFPDGGTVAFHGGDTPSVGTASSAGCLRMRNRDALRLSQLVREGTPVKIAP